MQINNTCMFVGISIKMLPWAMVNPNTLYVGYICMSNTCIFVEIILEVLPRIMVLSRVK